MSERGKYRVTDAGRQRMSRAGHITTRGRRLVLAEDVAESSVEPDSLLTKLFDTTTDDEIAAISAEIGATGARRPASE